MNARETLTEFVQRYGPGAGHAVRFPELLDAVEREARERVTGAAVARPGDTVLVGFERALTDEDVENLREGFKGFTEATGVHIGFVEGVSSMTVLRPDEPVPYTLTEQADAVGE